MGNAFVLDILSPRKKLLNLEVSEVILPAYDGQCGVLAEHGDFVGLLGTGPLKMMTSDGRQWCMVSSGVYQVSGNHLTIFAELAEEPDDIEIGEAKDRAKEIEYIFSDHQQFSPDDFDVLKEDLELNQARITVCEEK